MSALRNGQHFAAAGDVIISPTYVPDLVHAALDLLIDGESGIWHLANSGAVSWADLARHIARRAGLDDQLVDGRRVASMSLAAPRPIYTGLLSERGQLLGSWEGAVDRYLHERSLAEVPREDALEPQLIQS
jgi:dTDP-4-dehydrorhamnose reductase